jgi:hypothetical protein
MKTLFFALSLVTLSLPVLAQTNLEVNVGPAFSNVSMKGLSSSFRPDRTLHAGLLAQVLASKNIGNHFEVETGLAYQEKGFHIKEGINMDILNLPVKLGVEAITTMRYIQIPLHLKYNLSSQGIQVFVFAGPSVGYAMSGNVRTRANFIFDVNINNTRLDLNQTMYNRIELGGNAGGGIGLPIGDGQLTARFNFNQGFNRVIDNTLVDLRLKNYGFGMNIGYKLSL